MNALSNDRDVFPLKDAAERFGFTVSTLKAEAGRGRLTLYKIGKKLYTTPADIHEMVNRCRVEQKVWSAPLEPDRIRRQF